MFLCTQKAQKATFFALDVFMRTKLAKSKRHKALLLRRFHAHKKWSFLFAYVQFVFFYGFLPLRRFYARLRLFLFSFAYVLFMFFYVK